MLHALHDGPWFIFNSFLSVKKWEPKFVPSQAHLSYSAIWVRLPELPTEFYEIDILQKVGNKIGTLLKIDACTSATTRERYARLCVQVPLEQPLQQHIYIGTHKQQIEYEGSKLLCIKCGRLGHAPALCSFAASRIVHEQDAPAHTATREDE